MGCGYSSPEGIVDEIREIEHMSFNNLDSNTDNLDITKDVNSDRTKDINSDKNNYDYNKFKKVSKSYNLSQK